MTKSNVIGVLAALFFFTALPAWAQLTQVSDPDFPPADGANVLPTPPSGTVLLLEQQPNGNFGVYADSDCDFCMGPQSIADNFVLSVAPADIAYLAWIGGWFLSPTGSEQALFDINVYADSAGLPDTSSVQCTLTGQTPSATGSSPDIAYELTLSPGTCTLTTTGTYWIEIFNTTVDDQDWAWETGNPDTLPPSVVDFAAAYETPGQTWFLAELGEELALSIGELTTATWEVEKVFEGGAGGATADITINCSSGNVNNTGNTTDTQTVAGGGTAVFEVVGFDTSNGGTQCTISEDTPTDFYYGELNDSPDCDVTGVQHRATYDGCQVINRETRSTIRVYKQFNDGNPSEVNVHLDCDFALIADQDQNPSEGHPINFVVTNFISGESNCSVYETPVPTGYVVSYSEESSSGPWSLEPCSYGPFFGGEEEDCWVRNELLPIKFDVRKLWFDEHPEFNNSTFARAKWECDNTSPATGLCPTFFVCPGFDNPLWFDDEDSSDFFLVWPHWNGMTECDVNERIKDSSVESDDWDCQDVPVLLGVDVDPIEDEEWECTITNTRVYEGIPTLSQYGLAVLALLMLGVGLIGFRRFA